MAAAAARPPSPKGSSTGPGHDAADGVAAPGSGTAAAAVRQRPPHWAMPRAVAPDSAATAAPRCAAAATAKMPPAPPPKLRCCRHRCRTEEILRSAFPLQHRQSSPALTAATVLELRLQQRLCYLDHPGRPPEGLGKRFPASCFAPSPSPPPPPPPTTAQPLGGG